MRPFMINWTASTATFVASAQALTSGAQLVLNNTVPQANIFSQNISNNVTIIPIGTARRLKIVNPAVAVTYVITGLDQNGQPASESVVFSGAATQYSVKTYTQVQAIVPNATSALTVTVGTGGGQTIWYICDQWNKNALYSFGYSTSGTVSLSPTYTLEILDFVNYVQTYNSAPTTYDIPVGEDGILISPVGTTLPITVAKAAISTRGIPRAAFSTYVSDETTGSFTKTILQQGGRF